MRNFLALGILGLAGVSAAQSIDPYELVTIFRMQDEADRSEARALALAYGLPLRQNLPNGRLMELHKFRNGRPIYRITDNANAAITTRANRVYSGGGAGLSLSGSGIVLGEWDGGRAMPTHQELTGRVTNPDGAGTNWHSTHVGGTMIASGVAAAAKGMSWGATLRSFDWNSDSTEMASEAAGGLRLSNHSYGFVTGWLWTGSVWRWYGDRVAGHVEDAGFGFYDDGAQAWDTIAYNNPYYLIFKSAGNDRLEGPPSQPTAHLEWNGSTWISVNDVRPLDGGPSGYDSVSYSSTAKNIMTVGAVGDVPNYTGPASVNMSGFSCFGPTDDGRIKPDIVANGVGVVSSYYNGTATTNLYASSDGTSMASPNACGSAGLIVQHFKNLAGGNAPRSDLLKGLVIHTADECGAAPGPDYRFGWGLMDTEAACAAITDNFDNGSPRKGARMRYFSKVPNQNFTVRVKRSTAAPIKITICWTDPAGTPPAWSVDPSAKMLVRNLDMRITPPGGGTLFPWVLDPANPANAATTGDNTVDNVEQIVIDNTVDGTYVIAVLGPQQNIPFAMVLDNCEPIPADFQGIGATPSTFFSGSASTGTVFFSGSPFNAVWVTLSDNSGTVTLPPNVMVEATSQATFPITTAPATVDQTVTITGVCQGITKTNTLTVWATFALQSTWLNKVRAIGGSTPLTAFVRMNHPAPAPDSVSLSSDSPNMTPPASVNIPLSQQTVSTLIPTTETAADHLATLTATKSPVTKTATVTIISPPVLNAINVPASVVGGNSVPGTVYFNKAGPTDGVLIAISDNVAEMTTPTHALIPGHQWFGNFTSTTVAVVSPVVATMSATYRGVTRTDTITINP